MARDSPGWHDMLPLYNDLFNAIRQMMDRPNEARNGYDI